MNPGTNAYPRKSTARFLWMIFSLFVVYGTSFPFAFKPGRYPIYKLLHRVNWHLLSSIPDMIQNVLLFIPFGFLGYFSLIRKSSPKRKWVIVLMGCSLSTFVEFLQIFSWSRFPALADVIFNTLGTGVGLLFGVQLKKSVLGIKSHPTFRGFLDAPAAFPAVVFLILVVGGTWAPFDFSLEVGSMWRRFQPLFHYSWHFSMPDDDLVAGIHFLLATLFLCRVLKEVKWPRPAYTGVLFMIIAGIALEGTQLIIASRYPEIQDALVGILGAVLGGIVFHFPGFRERPWMWSLASVVGIFLAATVKKLHPLHFQSSHTGFNWIPFLPHASMSTAATAGEFLANAMVYFPLGFLMRYFFPRSRLAPWSALFLAGCMAMVLEVAGGYVSGGYSDVTGVLGAMLGSLIGSLVLIRGWPAFTEYMREDRDRQV